MAEIFFFSGWQKLQDLLNDNWDSVIFLFEDVHPVPLLPAEIAAYLGMGGELLLGAMLALGLLGRFAALGLIVMTVVIELSLGEGSPTMLHVSWALMLAPILAYGPGMISADALLGKAAAPKEKQ